VDDPANGVGVGDEILATLFGRPQVQPGRQLPDRSRVQEADGIGQRRPSFDVQAGQAPQPCAAWTRLATAIWASRLFSFGIPLPP
jgi:hypothetical protein